MPAYFTNGAKRGRRLLHGFVLSALTYVSPLHPAHAAQLFELRSISSRPDTVSGDDVLVQVGVSNDSSWNVYLNRRDVTPSFRLSTAGDAHWIALLTGLKPGKNTVEVRVNGRGKSKLQILTHPRTGPIFSGPHQEPFICQTEVHGLGPALDSSCSARTIVQYYYKSTEPVQLAGLEAIKDAMAAAPGSLAPGFKAYDPASNTPPSDIAQTITSHGQTVDYIVRREIGTINRAIYDIQFLHQPGQPLPTPWTRPTPGWNGRLVYVFGGGISAGYRQGTLGRTGKDQEPLLAQGYAVATSTLNIFGNTSNDRVSAETLSMVKEHFIEQYGRPVHTIGSGGSGGSMQVHLIAQNYPGLLDGITPFIGPPDHTTTVQGVTDCALLDSAFKASRQPWTEEQKSAVSGYATWRTCAQRWYDLSPQRCHALIPRDAIYDRITNPKGVRCTIYDNEITIFGRDPRTGFAYRPLDNVGVQYGLRAFNAGKIDAEQFIELNEKVGGYDADGNIIATRTQADAEALRIAYQRGLIVTGGGGLGEIPIIDWRWYLDDLADSHVRVGSFQTRARLVAANGHADNQVILVYPRPSLSNPFGDDNVVRPGDIVRQMDRWLDNIAADDTAGTLSEKISRNKPLDIADGCWATDGERIVEPALYEGLGRCNQLYPPHANPRIASGAPLTNDVLKCALKPINPADYKQALNSDQLQRLKGIFPTGVCDYSRPGVGQQVTHAVWQRYSSAQ